MCAYGMHTGSCDAADRGRRAGPLGPWKSGLFYKAPVSSFQPETQRDLTCLVSLAPYTLAMVRLQMVLVMTWQVSVTVPDVLRKTCHLFTWHCQRWAL